MPILVDSSVWFLARAESYRLLRRQGVTIRSTIDYLDPPPSAWEGLELLHNDRDFDTFARHLPLRASWNAA